MKLSTAFRLFGTILIVCCFSCCGLSMLFESPSQRARRLQWQKETETLGRGVRQMDESLDAYKQQFGYRPSKPYSQQEIDRLNAIYQAISKDQDSKPFR